VTVVALLLAHGAYTPSINKAEITKKHVIDVINLYENEVNFVIIHSYCHLLRQ
jgi:hypothetical protein